MPSLPRYWYPDYITYRESVIKEPPLMHSDRFDKENRSIQKKKYKVTKQVYRVKKDGRLSKNSDLTQRIEKPTVEKTSASSIEQIAPDVEYIFSNNIAEQKLSSTGGQDDLKVTGSDGTGLTGVSTGLTGAKTSLTGASSEFGNSSKAKNWIRPSFKELLAKYEKMGAT